MRKMRYTIQYKPAAVRSLRALPRDIQTRLQAAIEALASDPFAGDTRKMAGHRDRWRLRVGSYRVIYEVYGHELLILIIAVGHRKDIYR